MSGIKAGFSLIEVMIVIALIGMMTIIIIPRLSKKNHAKQREDFVMQLNALVRSGAMEALVSNMMHRVTLDPVARTVRVEQQRTSNDTKDEKLFGPSKRPYINKVVSIASSYSIKNVMVDGVDMSARSSSASNQPIHFYIMPPGVAQSVAITILDKNYAHGSSKGQEFTVVLNPLTVQFQVYNA